MASRLRRSERGTAILEVALTLPLVLLVSVGIFEFGRAYQTWQVLTNAAREGARLAVVPGASATNVETRVRQYMQDGQLPGFATATVSITPATLALGGGLTAGASLVTVQYPFSFVVLNPVARLVVANSSLGKAPMTITASSEMRNE